MSQSKYNASWKVVDLQKEAKRLKISYSGTKSELIQRLNKRLKIEEKEVEVEEIEAPNEDKSEELELQEVSIREQEVEEPEPENVINKNGKRVRGVYAPFKTFTTENGAIDFMISENWIKQRDRYTKRSGRKWWYNCKFCSVNAYILLNRDDEDFTVYMSNLEHEHTNTEIKKKAGIDEFTKQQIHLIYAKKMTTATLILMELRVRNQQFLPKKYESDPDVENPKYVPGLTLPTIDQLNNYLNRTYRPSILGICGASSDKFTYSDLEIWLKNNTIDLERIYELNPHEPFVISHDIKVNIQVESGMV
jgi:hypothetical protein